MNNTKSFLVIFLIVLNIYPCHGDRAESTGNSSAFQKKDTRQGNDNIPPPPPMYDEEDKPLIADTMYLDDIMGWSDKMRVINISAMTIIDAQLKIRQIAGILDKHYYLLAFDVGVLMGNMREKYRRMVETYREYRDKHTERSVFFPSGFMRYFISGYYIVAMQLIHTQEVEIDKLVHILETIDSEDLNPDPRDVNMERTTKPRLRARDMEIIHQMEEEQELKRSMREKHLLRRLNKDVKQHTTSKRFQQQWPVEERWELGAYGDMGLYGGH